MYKRVADEIGSEFWEPETFGDVKYLLTGRTALDFIIRDILAEHDVKSVLMPSYCCHTMIMPFTLHGIEVRFYDVFFDGGLTVDVPECRKNELFLYIKYFGYEALQGEIGEHELIIEDQTHSWMNGVESKADYTYASYKKWTGISGIARAVKKHGKFIEFPLADNIAFNEMREKAFSLKKHYIENGIGNKLEFLDLFDKAEVLIETDYCGYRPSQRAFEQLLELNRGSICEKRRRNAEFLIDELKRIPNIQLLYDHIGEKDVPLFVPILAENRNALRRYLIDNNIYLPVHWPFSDCHKGISERATRLYDQELSVVCDQRYELDDMERIISTVEEFHSVSND